MRKRQKFSAGRFWALVVKEFVQMRRDRLTFTIMFAVPIMQLLIFGFVINSDPKHLPAAVLLADHGPEARSLLYAMRNSGYLNFIREMKTEAEARDALAHGEIQFVVTIPVNFTRDLLRGLRPAVLIEADATDPATTSNALGALRAVFTTPLSHDLKGPLAFLAPGPDPVEFRIHALYNPEGITQYNVVPGLIGLVLTMTMVMINALAMAREKESGTMENLLSMPTRPTEVLVGKIVPYILVGYVQVGVILFFARFLFHVPMVGSLWLLLAAALVFITANLAVGVTISTIAANQRQAMQMTMFFFLPNVMLSGFAFPFRGMPGWAQVVGEMLPLTHFLRIIRGILLKGNGITDIAPQLWPIALFAAVALALGVKRYRRTLD
jgi:ABC-2 type transport system permease protein